MGMRQDNRTLYSAISLIIALFLGMGLSAIYAVFDLNRDVERLYRHPFAVSNAVKNIRIHLASMRGMMNDIIQLESDENILKQARTISDRDIEVLREFDTIFDRFLGNPEQIHAFHDAFTEWRSSRDEVIFLVRSGQRQAAKALSQGRQAEQAAALERQATDVVDFAVAKAREFQAKAAERRENYFLLLGMLLALVLLLSIWITQKAMMRLHRSQQTLLRQSQLIDEHIGMATMDTAGQIKTASRQLARMLSVPPRKLPGLRAEAILPVGEDAPSVQDIIDFGGSGRNWFGRAQSADADVAAKFFSLEAHPVHDEHLNVQEFMLLYEDITEKVRIEELSRIDKLTDLPNRRAYDERIEYLVRRARRDRCNLTLAVIDVDNFKAFNDLYGHPQGDYALTQVADVLTSAMRRPDDHAFRLGGEEFALLFIGLDVERSTKLLETVRSNVEALGLVHAGNTGVSNVLTVSIGAVVASDSHALRPQVMYQQADQQLYRAKRKRNDLAVLEGTELTVVENLAAAEHPADHQQEKS